MAQKAATQFPTSNAETYLQLDDLTGSVSTKVLTGSVWLKSSSSDAQVFGYAINSAGINVLAWSMQADGSINLNCWDSAGIVRVKLTSDTTGYNDGAWHHVAFSFDTTTATQFAQLYVDGVSDMTSPTTLSDAEIDFDTGGSSFHRVGINVTGGSRAPYDGCLTEYWLGWEDIDLSTSIGGFYNNGEAVPLGADGSTPTGRQPEIYLTGGEASIATNLGSGENFTKVEQVGSPLTDCADGPEIYSVTKAIDCTTRLGLYGGPRAELEDVAEKDEISQTSPTGGWGASGPRSGRILRTYREDETETERRQRIRKQREAMRIVEPEKAPDPEIIRLPRRRPARNLGPDEIRSALSTSERLRLIEALEAEQRRTRRLRLAAILLLAS